MHYILLFICLLFNTVVFAQTEPNLTPKSFSFENIEKSQLNDPSELELLSFRMDEITQKLYEFDVNNSSINFSREKMHIELWYVMSLCVLSFLSLLVVLNFIRRQEKHTAKDIVNATGLTLIIFGTIILVLVVNTSEQLTAAIGILGAIAGYLFRSVQEENIAS